MLKLFCQICGEPLKVDESRLPESERLKIRCPGCGGIFLFDQSWKRDVKAGDADSVADVVRDELFSLDTREFRKLLQSQVFWLILILAGMPMILNMLNVEIVRGMTVYFSIIWFFVFIKLFQYEGSNFKLHLGVYFFSLVSLSPSFHLIHSLASPFYSFISSESAALRFLGFFAGVGITEELTKAVPIFILVVLTRRRGEQLSGMDYLLCGIMSGLAFAGVENFGYIRMAVIRDVLWGSLGDGAVTSLVRSTLTPFIHSCLSGIFAYFIGLPSFYPSKSPWPFFLSGLLVSAFLHAVYDFAVTSTIFSQPLAFLALAMMYMGLLICWLNLKTKFRRTQREEMDNYIKDII